MSQSALSALFKLRVRYGKLGRLKYLGHLEVIHTIEQIVRRARLPYAVTQGFSPHMRIAFTSALPVGTSSACEYFDVVLTELVAAPDALQRLQAAAPPDLMPDAAAYVDMRTPALTAQITRVGYLVELSFRAGCAPSEERLLGALAHVHDAGEIPYTRGKKQKVLDLRRTLVSSDVTVAEGDHARLELQTRCDNEGSLRPEIVFAALDQVLRGLDPGAEEIVSTGIQDLSCIESYRVERISQQIEQEDGALATPLEHEPEPPRGSMLRDALANL